MTLIIARKDENQIYMIGDTELTYHSRKTNPFIDGCIKQYIINDNLAIAFAGVKEDFQEDLSSYLQANSKEEIFKISLESLNKGFDYQLIIAQVNPPQLFFFKHGNITEADAGFIGDIDGFNCYQKFYHQAENQDNIEKGRGELTIFQMPEPNPRNNNYL